MRNAFALLIAAATLAMTPAHAETSEVRIQAFQQTCVAGNASLQGVLDRAAAEGWRVVDASAHAQLPKALELSSAIIPVVEPAYLQRDLSGGSVFMIVGQGAGRFASAVGCYVFDFDAPQLGDEAAIATWLAAPPTAREEYPSHLYMARWHMPGQPNVMVVGVSFIAPGSEAAAELGIAGAMLASVSAEQ